MRRNYQWWREHATNAENRAADGHGAGSSRSPDNIHARQRAIAAAMIAEEANAARMKSLLDAARDQADRNTIESAEKWFNDAREEFETVREAIVAPGEPEAAEIESEIDAAATQVEPDAVAVQVKENDKAVLAESQDFGNLPRETPFAVEIIDAVNRVFKRISPEQKVIGLGVPVAMLLGFGVGAGGYTIWNDFPDGVPTAEPVAVESERPIDSVETAQPGAAPVNDVALSALPPAANDLPIEPIVIPASTGTDAAPIKALVPPKPEVSPRMPKRVHSITLPAAAPPPNNDVGTQPARRTVPDTGIRLATRASAAAHRPSVPPAPNPRIASVSDVQTSLPPPPPPNPPVQIEEAE